MIGDDDFPWSEIRRHYEGNELTKPEICARFGLSPWRLDQQRAANGWTVRPHGWKRTARSIRKVVDGAANVDADGKSAKRNNYCSKTNRAGAESSSTAHRKPETMASRRAELIRRLFNAIETELTIIEERMQDKDNRSPTDSERDTRSIGALIKNLEKLTEFDEQLKGAEGRGGGDKGGGIKGITADEADRIRRDLAARIERIIKS